MKEVNNSWPKELFYITGNTKSAINNFSSLGFNFLHDENDVYKDYNCILVNNSTYKEGDLNPGDFFLTDLDKSDGKKIFSVGNDGFYYSSVSENKVPKGKKFSKDKAPMGQMIKQFPLALEAVAMRSKFGHEKYKETDHDWMNFKRVENAEQQYLSAAIRHIAGLGEEEETPLEHLKAAAWNILATLQITLEKNND